MYFGQWPEWTPFFLKSCTINKDIDFIIISESNPCKIDAQNIYYRKHSIEDFSERIQNRLALNFKIQDLYKICDFKPTYGILFEDLLKPYKHWGYCDVDLLFGDLSKYGVIDKILSSDIYLGYLNFASGPFTVLRNSQRTTKLFKSIYNYKEILCNPELQGMDEHIIKKENCGFSFWKAILLIKFILNNLTQNLNKINSVAKLKNGFQWYVKRKRVTRPVDFTEAIIKAEDQIGLKICYDSSIMNDSEFILEKQKHWEIKFDGSRLINSKTGDQYPIFHFIQSKRNQSFVCSDNAKSTFIVNSKGIFNV